MRIDGLSVAFAREAVEVVGGLGPTVLVGVDDIPSRWTVQRAAPGWVSVGATSHGFVMVSGHEPNAACAGCAHPRDESLEGQIPTISFVSFWGGLLQARALLAHAAKVAMPAVNVAWPFGLFGSRGLQAFPLQPAATCPVGCTASRRV